MDLPLKTIFAIARVNYHCVKIVQIRSYFWSLFSPIQTEYGPEITLYLDTFQAVYFMRNVWIEWYNDTNIHLPISGERSDFIHLESTRKPKVHWCFQEVRERECWLEIGYHSLSYKHTTCTSRCNDLETVVSFQLGI